MDTERVLQRLRRFLLTLAGAICIGTPVELWLAEHTESPTQLLPFALCGLGLLSVVAALRLPRRATLLGMRAAMGLLLLGAGFGIFEHLEHNLAFELEIRPGAAAGDVWLEALRGPNPLLAPGILALAGLLALAASWSHPALARPGLSTDNSEP